MTKPDNSPPEPHFEKQISALYQARKKQHKATAWMKRRTLKQARKPSAWRQTIWRAQWLAVAASTLLLISLVAMRGQQLFSPHSPLQYTAVELHQMESESLPEQQQISQLYAQHFNQYMQQKSFLTAHHQKSAVLIQQPDGWELTTCEQELVKISNQLVAALKTMDLIPAAIKSGDNVQIAYNHGGKIIGIRPKLTYLQC